MSACPVICSMRTIILRFISAFLVRKSITAIMQDRTAKNVTTVAFHVQDLCRLNARLAIYLYRILKLIQKSAYFAIN